MNLEDLIESYKDGNVEPTYIDEDDIYRIAERWSEHMAWKVLREFSFANNWPIDQIKAEFKEYWNKIK